jgi:hypothetical protein
MKLFDELGQQVGGARAGIGVLRGRQASVQVGGWVLHGRRRGDNRRGPMKGIDAWFGRKNGHSEESERGGEEGENRVKIKECHGSG